eukprot:TRINITY_DN10830_c0_g1_i1.p1 TRINITY_DN10830_c0_g1~~TRINITY_DN10830_c0_g1_i1.p1  ORF type:complete len:339 (+),score=103.86 TRINITY_DN10830_c0_g1_i1:56-1018(+)
MGADSDSDEQPRNQHSDRDLLDAHLATELRVPVAFPDVESRARKVDMKLRADVADTLAFRSRAFVVEELLSAEECAAIREAVSAEGMRTVTLECGSGSCMRRCERLSFRSKEIEDRLWERVGPLLEPQYCTEENRQWYLSRGMEGRWDPRGLSGVLRVVRYNGSGHISPHYDGEFVVDEEERSLKTILLYLSDEYSGGRTNFLDHRDENISTRYTVTETGATKGAEEDVVGVVPAGLGSAIVFDNKMLHEGTEVTAGEKWLLRADIVYRRVERRDPEGSVRHQACLLLNQAELMEEEKNYDEAVRLYRWAYRLCPELQYE